MSALRKWAWSAVVVVAAASPASAQMGTVTSTGGITTGSLTGTGGLTGGGAGQLGSSNGLGGSSSLGGNSSTSGSTLQGSSLSTMQAPPKLTPPTGTAASSLASSNVFAGFYANPYYQGTVNAQTNAAPGGFGMPLYGNSGTGSVNSGRTPTAGAGNRASTTNNISGIVVPLPVQITYSAQMQFPTPRVAAGAMQTDLRSVIDGNPLLSNPKGVKFVVDANNNVTLRGTVADDDEARLIEGMVRLTPGVGGIKNELTATASVRPGK
jgi:hypothetical protein